MSIRERYHSIHNYLVRNKYLDNWTFWHTILAAIGARVLLVWWEPWPVIFFIAWVAVMWEWVETNWAPPSSYGSVR
ncbi:unnamed protein product, partial [marine sediment metagenome]